MKSTDTFKNTIQEYLTKRGQEDPLFAETLKKENKSIDDCITYIFNEVEKSGCNGFADSEIYGMAVHYYDEDDIKPGKAVSGRVVVNHNVELTAEEKAEAKQKALDDIIEKERQKILNKGARKSEAAKKKIETPQPVIAQSSLF